MLAGKIVRCKHWSGPLLLKIESVEYPLLLSNIIEKDGEIWVHATYLLIYETFTDYIIL